MSDLGGKIRAVSEFNDRPMEALAREADKLEQERDDYRDVAQRATARSSEYELALLRVKGLAGLLKYGPHGLVIFQILAAIEGGTSYTAEDA